MSVALRGSSTPVVSSTSVTSDSITLSASIKGGDTIFIDCYTAGTATVPAPTAPTGFTQLDTVLTASNTVRLTVFTKKAAGTLGGSSSDAGASASIPFNASVACMLKSDAYSGADQTTPIPQHGIAAQSGAATSHTMPSVTTTVANSWIRETLCDKGSAATYTLPGGFTARSGGLVSLTGGAVAQMETADTNGGVSTGAHGGDAWVSTLSTATALMATQAIAPAAGSAPTANAGPDQTTVEPFSTVTLDATGSASTDGGTLTYSWAHTSGPGSAGLLSSTTVAQPTYTAPAALTDQTDVWTVTVTDSVSGLNASDSVSITVLAAGQAYLNSSGTWVAMQIVQL